MSQAPDAKAEADANEELLSDDDAPPEEDQFGRMIYLQTCGELRISPVSQILKFLESEDMNIHHYGLGLKGTLALVDALRINSNIRTVRLTNNNIPDEALMALVKCVGTRPHITELNISGNKMGPTGCRALADLIATKGCPLRTINVSHMHISDKDGAGLCTAVENNETLRHFDLSNNDLGDKSALALGAALSGNLGLVDLNLSWNKLRPKGVAHLAEGLAPNLNVQVLGLAWCGMQDQGAEAFGAMLKTNNSLLDIDLCGNGITVLGASPLAGGIGASKSLAAVALDNNDLREEGGRMVLEAVTQNEGIVKVQLENTNTSLELRHVIEGMLQPRLEALKAHQTQ